MKLLLFFLISLVAAETDPGDLTGGNPNAGGGCSGLTDTDCQGRTECMWQSDHCRDKECFDAMNETECTDWADYGCEWDYNLTSCHNADEGSGSGAHDGNEGSGSGAHDGSGDGHQQGCSDWTDQGQKSCEGHHNCMWEHNYCREKDCDVRGKDDCNHGDGCKWDDNHGCYHDSGNEHQPECNAITQTACAEMQDQGCRWHDNVHCYYDGCAALSETSCFGASEHGCLWDSASGCSYDEDRFDPTPENCWYHDEHECKSNGCLWKDNSCAKNHNTQTTTAGPIEVNFTPEQVLGWGQDSKFRQWQVYVVYGGWCFQKYGNWPRKHWNEEGTWGQWCDRRFGGFSAQWWYSYTDKGRACFDAVEGDKNADADVEAQFHSWGAYGERCKNEYFNHNVWHRSDEIMEEQLQHGGMISNVRTNLRGGHQPEL